MAKLSGLQVRTKLTLESKRDKNKVDGLPRLGQYAVEQIRLVMINKKITATGRTQQSLRYDLTGAFGLRILAGAGDRAPIETLQWGRAPGKRPSIAKLIEWIEAKRIPVQPIPYIRQPSAKWKPKHTPQERGLNAMAWAISTKIKKFGTNRYMQPDTEVYSPVLNETIELYKMYIIKDMTANIVKSIIK